MGSCLSLNRGPGKLLIASPVKLKPDTVNAADHAVAVKPQWSSSRFGSEAKFVAGSKEDAFFDSQPWIESDCEDDFLSVNGDFTPSSGSTPVHHKFSSGPNKAQARDVDEGTPSSPDNKKKRLSELFKESLRRDHNVDLENAANDHNVGHEKENDYTERTTTNGVYSNRAEDEPVKSAQCCIPRLVTSRSFSERKKKTSDG